MSCADFGRLILSKRERILEVWRHEVRKIFGLENKEWLLDDKVPVLLGAVAEALGYTPPSRQSTEGQTKRSEEHGIERAEQGFNVVQITREFHMLRRAIRETSAEEGRPLTNEATSIIAEVLDTAAEIALGTLSKKREETIKEDAARKMSFIVHDFRTPLGAVALAATEIVDAIPPDAKTSEMMESMATFERNLERLSIGMEQTMRELASVFSGNEQLQITNVRLHDVAEEVIEQLRTLASTKNVVLSNRVDVAEELAAAPGALQRVLMNLTSNALRYTRDGEITIASSQKGDDIEVVVQDTGRGILPEKLARIFEPGEKESSSPGMGFGLAIAKYLVERHGGHIRIESTVDKGTSVIFMLPRTPHL